MYVYTHIHTHVYGIELTISPYIDGAICACSNHFIGLSGMVLSPGYYLAMNLWWWIGLEDRSINKIPCPDTAIFVAADHACLSVSKACTTSIRCVHVPPEIVEHLARSNIEKSHLRIEGCYEEGGSIRGWNDRSHWLANKVCSEFTFAEVICSHIPVHRTGDDGGCVDMESLYCVFSFFEDLYRGPALRPQIPKPNRRIVRTTRKHSGIGIKLD